MTMIKTFKESYLMIIGGVIGAFMTEVYRHITEGIIRGTNIWTIILSTILILAIAIIAGGLGITAVEYCIAKIKK